MVITFLQRLLVFFILCLTQVLVLNRIQLFNCAVPLFYVYFAVMFPRGYGKGFMLLWCFAMGITIDVFTNTPGVAAASMTLVGFLQPYLVEFFLPRDADAHMKISAAVMGWSKFVALSSLLVLIYCIVFFALESFSFFDPLHWLACILGSALLTLALIFTIESVRK